MLKILKYSENASLDESSKVDIPDMKKVCTTNQDGEGEFEQPELEEVSLTELAQIEANKIIEEANIYCEGLIDQAKQEYSNICNEAMKQGYDEAFQAQLESITDCLNQTHQTLTDINKAYASYMHEYAQKLPHFAIEIASSIMKTKIEEDPLVMCDLVEGVMSNIRETNWAVITLSRELVPLIELLRSELPAKCPTIASLEIRGAELEKGRCVVDFAGGIIDASIGEQIENLAKRFEQISQKRR